MDVRRARAADADAVASFTADTWPGRAEDYVADAFCEWIRGDDESLTLVAVDDDDDVVGLIRGVLLSDHEAWLQAMRVAPAVRGGGVGTALAEAAFDWARESGATVARCMVLSWNAAGLGQSRAVGFEPETEFRWINPAPDPDATPEGAVRADPDAAWTFWTRSVACRHLRGLVLDDAVPWSVSALTRERLAAAAADDRLLVAHEPGVGTRGFAFRVRVDEYEGEPRAEYGIGAWADAAACRDVLAAVSRDAASVGAETARVPIPERVETVSDVATARVDVGEAPDFVLTADLTARDQ